MPVNTDLSDEDRRLSWHEHGHAIAGMDRFGWQSRQFPLSRRPPPTSISRAIDDKCVACPMV